MAPTPEQPTVIRSARPADTPAIARVHVDSWRTTYRGIVPDSVLDSLDYSEREAMWRRAIADSVGRQFVYVAEAVNGTIVGFVAGGPERSGAFDGYSGEIYAIYLKQQARGTGIGRQLMRAAVRALVDQGHPSMLIWALTENPFCGFYRHLGGIPIGTQNTTMGRKTLEETAFGWNDIAGLLDGERSGNR